MPRPGRKLRSTRRDKARRPPGRYAPLLPTIMTLGNVVCGFLAIFFATRDPATTMPFEWSPIAFGAVFIFLGMGFDALDGRLARLTRQTSELGEQLDSMADMVTFGVAPAMLVVLLIGVGEPFVSDTINSLYNRTALGIALLFVAFAALRLARFNVEHRLGVATDPNYFKGLPTPGAAGTLASLVLLHDFLDPGIVATTAEGADGPAATNADWRMATSATVLLCVMLLVSFAMISRLSYVHIMNRYIRGRVRFREVARIVAALILLVMWPSWVLAVVFVAYAVSAPLGKALRGREFGVPAPDGRPAGEAASESNPSAPKTDDHEADQPQPANASKDSVDTAGNGSGR
ncbi:MAG: phosphatidylcholine/phosphatidylserine synthase [Phycisphaeraceae bacterium]|nr:phosphatidylcholine/phosphatidylserine synthase [Phycisphaeraceae bacterium]